MFRSCRDRRDHVGGVNNFASLDQLHQPAALAHRIDLAGDSLRRKRSRSTTKD
jgi:hypothetical protein